MQCASISVPSCPKPGDTEVQLGWLNDVLHLQNVINEDTKVTEVRVTDLEGNRGFSGGISKLWLTYSSEDAVAPASLILKMTNLRVDSFREAMFYVYYAEAFAQYIPEVLYAFADEATSTSVFLMRDFKENTVGIDCNFLLGNQVWGIPDNAFDTVTPPAPLEVVREMFLTAAEWNAKYWNDQSLMDHFWMKNVPWYKGEYRERWEHSLEFAKTGWNKCKSKIASGECSVKLDKKFVEMMDLSFEKTSWEGLQAHLQSPDVPFTICHGDFHASNMYWCKDAPHLKFFDWTEFGPWEPCADLGQTIISDVKPSDWVGKDVGILREYWEKLTSLGVSAEEFTFEKCLEGYERAPMERWVWSFGLMFEFDVPDSLMQYFHDQMKAFMDNHSPHDFYIVKPIGTLMLNPDRANSD